LEGWERKEEREGRKGDTPRFLPGLTPLIIIIIIISPADRRGEMRVDGCCQSVVKVIVGCECPTAEVDGLHHAARGEDTQHCVEVRIVRQHCGVQRLSQ